MTKLISKYTLETEDVTPYSLSHSIDYVFSNMLKELKAEMLSNPNQTFMLEITTNK